MLSSSSHWCNIGNWRVARFARSKCIMVHSVCYWNTQLHATASFVRMNYHITKADKAEVKLHGFLTSVMDGDIRLPSHWVYFTPRAFMYVCMYVCTYPVHTEERHFLSMSGCCEERNNLGTYRESSSGSEAVHLSAQSLHSPTPPRVQPPQTQKLSEHLSSQCQSTKTTWPTAATSASRSQDPAFISDQTSLVTNRVRSFLHFVLQNSGHDCKSHHVYRHTFQNVLFKKHFIPRLCTGHVLAQHIHRNMEHWTQYPSYGLDEGGTWFYSRQWQTFFHSPEPQDRPCDQFGFTFSVYRWIFPGT
jgi:hypothetical protein